MFKIYSHLSDDTPEAANACGVQVPVSSGSSVNLQLNASATLASPVYKHGAIRPYCSHLLLFTNPLCCREMLV